MFYVIYKHVGFDIKHLVKIKEYRTTPDFTGDNIIKKYATDIHTCECSESLSGTML